MVNNSNADQLANGRLMSLDVMRGMIMILLCGESCMLYEAIKHTEPVYPIAALITQFFSPSLAWIAFLGSRSACSYVYGWNGNVYFL